MIAQEHVGLAKVLDGNIQAEGSVQIGRKAKRPAMERVPHSLVGVSQVQRVGMEVLVAAQ